MPEQTAFPHRRVGLVEDHESVAIGVSVMLEDEPDLELVCIATTVSEMLAQNVALDLAILDLRLADGSSPKSNVEPGGPQVLDIALHRGGKPVPRSLGRPCRRTGCCTQVRTDCRRG